MAERSGWFARVRVTSDCRYLQEAGSRHAQQIVVARQRPETARERNFMRPFKMVQRVRESHVAGHADDFHRRKKLFDAAVG